MSCTGSGTWPAAPKSTHTLTAGAFPPCISAHTLKTDSLFCVLHTAGMPNASYCNWIMGPTNWGGGIELAILARWVAGFLRFLYCPVLVLAFVP